MKEIRSFSLSANNLENRSVEGYAATFSDYDMGDFIERIAPSAFDDLANQDVRALYNHNPDTVLARYNKGAGTLSLKVDERGLLYGFELPNTTLGNDLKEMLSRGDISQSSWGFAVAAQEWDWSGEKAVRTITKVGKIFDVSLVTYPANPDTTVALRSLEAAQKEVETIKNIPMEENKETAPAPAAEVRADKFVDSSAVAQGFGKSEVRNLSKFNVVSLIREMRSGKLTGINAELNQEGIKEARTYGGSLNNADNGHAFHMPERMQEELRAQTVGGTSSVAGDLGGQLVQTVKSTFIDFLHPSTPVLDLCTKAENLQGDVDYPVEKTVPTLSWQTETGEEAAQDVTFGTVSSSPTRAAMTIELSNRLLVQEYSSGLQNRLINQLNRAYSTGVEEALLNGSGTSNEPTGIITALSGSYQTVGVPTHAKLIDNFELILANKDALMGRLAYVTDPATLAFLKSTKLDAGSGRFLADGSLANVLSSNGYSVYTTTVLPLFTAKHAMIFGNFEDVILGMWGGPVLMVNPYTKMKSSLTEIYMERQLDVTVARPDSFAAAIDIVYS